MRPPSHVIAVAAGFFLSIPALAQTLSDDNYYAWLHMQGNLLAQEKLLANSGRAAAEVLITNVNVVDVQQGEIREGVTVLVRNGKIAWLVEDFRETSIDDIARIDGSGYFLSPGLIDMHVHTHDDGDYLLHLANGVTSIREMNGWKWRLERRNMLREGRLFAPNMYITSKIINSSNFGGYAQPVATESEARDAVRRARLDGFDAIKIHNGLPLQLFRAVVDESSVQNLPLVGHIPVAVSVAEAIDSRMHTAEHFKGYIDDSVLQISDEDWLTPSVDTDMYLTPSFYTYRAHLRGTAAEEIYDEEVGKLLPHRELNWRPYIDEEADGITRLRQTIRPKSEEIFKTLLPHDIRWLAGTDSGGYELMVPGEALLEELEIMVSLGLSPAAALRSATSRAAAALDWSDTTGHIAAGMQADLLLLRANPLENISNLRELDAVFIRGILIHEPELLPETAPNLSRSRRTPRPYEFEHQVEKAESHAAAGYAQSTMSLQLWASLAADLGYNDLELRLRALIVH